MPSENRTIQAENDRLANEISSYCREKSTEVKAKIKGRDISDHELDVVINAATSDCPYLARLQSCWETLMALRWSGSLDVFAHAAAEADIHKFSDIDCCVRAMARSAVEHTVEFYVRDLIK